MYLEQNVLTRRETLSPHPHLMAVGSWGSSEEAVGPVYVRASVSRHHQDQGMVFLLQFPEDPRLPVIARPGHQRAPREHDISRAHLRMLQSKPIWMAKGVSGNNNQETHCLCLRCAAQERHSCESDDTSGTRLQEVRLTWYKLFIHWSSLKWASPSSSFSSPPPCLPFLAQSWWVAALICFSELAYT